MESVITQASNECLQSGVGRCGAKKIEVAFYGVASEPTVNTWMADETEQLLHTTTSSTTPSDTTSLWLPKADVANNGDFYVS